MSYIKHINYSFKLLEHVKHCIRLTYAYIPYYIRYAYVGQYLISIYDD